MKKFIESFLKKKVLSKCILIFSIMLLIILALFPRCVEVLNGNPVFGFDQGRDYLAVKSIVVDHKHTLIGSELGAGSAGISYLFHGPFYYYLLTIPFLIFGGNPSGGVALMFLISFASVFLSLIIAQKIFNNRFLGILVGLLVAVSPPLITQARFIWNSYPSTFFILLSFYFTYLLTQKKYIYTFLAAFFAGFVYNFEFAIAIPLSLTIFIYSLFIFKRNLSYYLVLISGFIVSYSPMLMFEARHNFQGIRSALLYSSGHAGIIDSIIQMQPFFADHLNSFINNFLSTFIIVFGEIKVFVFPVFLLIVVYLLISEKNRDVKKFMIFLLSLIPVSFLVFMNLKNSVWDYYLVHLHVAYIFMLAYVVYASYKQKRYELFILFIVIILALFIHSSVSAYKTTIYDLGDYGGTAKLKGKVDAIDYIYKDVNSKAFSLFVFSPPIYIYPYDYIVWWYGKQKYKYLPGNEKSGTFYLLIEPDHDKPWTYKGWMETVIRSGKVVWTKELPSGFIVQKRTLGI